MSTLNHPIRDLLLAGPETRGVPRRRGSEQRDIVSRELLVKRVISEFREMPCLRLTPPQAQRLFGLRSDVCARVIGQLIREGLLRLDPDGRYAATPLS